MELKVMMLIVALVPLGVVAANRDHNQALDGCRRECGGVQIPYPFGIGKSKTTGENCSMDEPFELTCEEQDSILKSGDFQVTSINITKGQVEMMAPVSKSCRDTSSDETTYLVTFPSFTVSRNDNKFVSVGCDTFGYLNSSYDGGRTYSTGCLSRCYGNMFDIVDESCSGFGCCQMDIPPNMVNISIQAASFDNFEESLSFNDCSYSFVVKNGNYTFYKKDLKKLRFDDVAVIYDWSIGNETCEASKNRGTNACKGNSKCVRFNANGYQCRCKFGFEGNPYHPDGCSDIDECKIGRHDCISDDNCHNMNGTYRCFCPKGQHGNGTKEGRCQENNALPKFVIGGGAGFIALFAVIFFLYWMYQKRKLSKLKEKFFKQNGGYILLQQISTRGESSQTVQLFTEDELKKATKNYDDKLIIGRGGYGTVFKGVLTNNRIVAIKKSKIVDESQIEQFINEVVVLSRINHRNVVKLLGCCLETEVPLLVYEFINNGTLFNFMHKGRNANNLVWETRLRIATEAAGALSYLHSAASIPIIHRDIKSANILLDSTYTAKVSDFGASRFVPQDQIALATMVQGTIGYLDPEYMQTSQLTEKSDVYSFGVVLAELLTGEEPLSFDRSEEKRSLAIYFLSCLKANRLSDAIQDGILNEKNEQEIKEVAILAAKCLSLKGEDRPSMKEVAMELEGIRVLQKHPWSNNNGDNNLAETQCLVLDESSSRIHMHSERCSHQNYRYDSINDQLSSSLDGR
ncbi:hypothetical protein HN51_017140 [Arachis hypogaea]|uniref:Protein kinase domain-containing protein n=1 Tax=Arachis hypogaea TaxID=3818 RepID=A0A445CW10_ARAHY|nr:Wall-associated receptor kinase [Arachis hypogaea]RYR55133.1 hypothetical protein Ahy_A06g030385 [Arachis hypogaea]